MLCISFARPSTTARNIKHVQRLILKLSLCSQQVTPWNPLDLKGQSTPWLYTSGHCYTSPEEEMVSRQVSKSGIYLRGNRVYEGLATAEESLSGILELKERTLASRVSGDVNACSFPKDSWFCRGRKDIYHH